QDLGGMRRLIMLRVQLRPEAAFLCIEGYIISAHRKQFPGFGISRKTSPEAAAIFLSRLYIESFQQFSLLGIPSEEQAKGFRIDEFSRKICVSSGNYQFTIFNLRRSSSEGAKTSCSLI